MSASAGGVSESLRTLGSPAPVVGCGEILAHRQSDQQKRRRDPKAPHTDRGKQKRSKGTATSKGQYVHGQLTKPLARRGSLFRATTVNEVTEIQHDLRCVAGHDGGRRGAREMDAVSGILDGHRGDECHSGRQRSPPVGIGDGTVGGRKKCAKDRQCELCGQQRARDGTGTPPGSSFLKSLNRINEIVRTHCYATSQQLCKERRSRTNST
jgi:hypothetical protein